MERDFLCAIGRKDKGTTSRAAEDDTGTEPDCPGGGGGGGGAPAMQWQFPPTKPGAAPALMSFRTTAREDDDDDGAKQFSISGFRPPAPAVGDAFDGVSRHAGPSPVMASQQRQFGFDAPAVTAQQYGRAPPPQGYGPVRMVQPLSSRHPFNQQANPMMLRTQSLQYNAVGGGGLFRTRQPFAMSMTGNGFTGSSTVGAYGARNPRSQNSTQLTIFYNGTVNVFDNVSIEKAQELMLLASRAASVSSTPNLVRKPDSPVSAPAKINVPEVVPARQVVATQKPEPSVCHRLPSASSPISIAPQSVAHPRGASNCTTDSAGPKTVLQTPVSVIVPTSQASSSRPMPLATTSAAAVMPRAVPQARKASLARFLEKRKERVTSVEPYPTPKSPLESSDTKGSASALSKSSFDVAPTSSNNNNKEPLRFGQPRNISFSSSEVVCASTKLQI